MACYLLGMFNCVFPAWFDTRISEGVLGMFVRTLAIFGAVSLFVAAHASEADAFGRHHRSGGYKTCYKKVTTPPVYQTVMKRVVVRPASCAQHRTPPTYGTVAQEVVVQPARQVVHHKPAVYGRVKEVREVRPARTHWVRGRGCHGADYKCAVTKPAKYRTRTKRVMVEAGHNWVETKPAVKSVVHRQVVVNPGTVRQVCQPAVYGTVAQQVMVSPGTEQWVPVAHSGHNYTRHQVAAQYSAPVVQHPVQYAPAARYHHSRHHMPLK